MEEGTEGPLLHAKFHPHRCNVSPMRGEKPQNRPLSKLNTGRFALRAMLPVKIATCAPSHNFVGLYLRNSSTCPHNMVNFGPLMTKTGWRVLGITGKFQRVSCLGFVTAPTWLNDRGQPQFARCLTVFCAGTLYIHFPGLFPLRDFCQVQNSLCVQVLRFPILAALLHGTRAVGMSQTLRRGARNGIKELLS